MTLLLQGALVLGFQHTFKLHIDFKNMQSHTNAFGGTFVFFSTHRPTLKKSKRATNQPHQDTPTMDGQSTTEKEQRRHNTGLAKVAVQCSADTFVVNQSFVLRINICGENRHLRQARKRYAQVCIMSRPKIA